MGRMCTLLAYCNTLTLVLVFALGCTQPNGSSVTRAPSVLATTRDTLAEAVIEPGKNVGPVRLGMTEAEVRRSLGEPGGPEIGNTIQYVRPPLPIGVMFDQHPEGRVIAILAGHACFPEMSLVRDFKARTSGGVGMGSSAAAIRAALGEPDDERAATDRGADADPSLSAHWRHMLYSGRGIEFILIDDRVNWLAVRHYESE